MIDQATFTKWVEQARRDDWHQTFVGSDIRQMLGEIGRLKAALQRYGLHTWDCAHNDSNGKLPCDCGWAALEAADDQERV